MYSISSRATIIQARCIKFEFPPLSAPCSYFLPSLCISLGCTKTGFDAQCIKHDICLNANRIWNQWSVSLHKFDDKVQIDDIYFVLKFFNFSFNVLAFGISNHSFDHYQVYENVKVCCCSLVFFFNKSFKHCSNINPATAPPKTSAWVQVWSQFGSLRPPTWVLSI